MSPVIFNPFRHGKEPDQVTGQGSTANSTSQITVSWDAVTVSPAVTSYVVEWSANGSSGWAEISESPTTSTSLADASLSTYTTYYYRIKAVNPLGSGEYSANTSTITNGVVPAQVTGLTATLDGEDVDLAWNVPSFNTPASGTYTVQRSTSSGSGFSDLVSSHGTNSYTDTTGSIGTTYYYQVKAVNAYGSGAYSSEASVLIPSPPDALIMGANYGNGARDEYSSFNIATTGDAIHGNSLTHNYSTCAGAATTTRAFVSGWWSGTNKKDIDTILIASGAAGTDFGELEEARNSAMSTCNNTYVITMGGGSHTFGLTTERFTAGTTGSSSDMGDLLVIDSGNTRYDLGAQNVRSSSRWVTGGCGTGTDSRTEHMLYDSFTSTGTCGDFGDLAAEVSNCVGVSNATRGVMCGGNGHPGLSTDTGYITIATTSNTTVSGDLEYATQHGAGVASSTRGVICGANGDTTMQYVSITSTADWQDFGELNTSRGQCAGGSHY